MSGVSWRYLHAALSVSPVLAAQSKTWNTTNATPAKHVFFYLRGGRTKVLDFSIAVGDYSFPAALIGAFNELVNEKKEIS